MHSAVLRRSSSGNVRNPAARAAILAAAMEILDQVGYGGFTIEEVARRSRAGKPTIYRWWKSKSALFMDVYLQRSATGEAPPDEGSLRADFVALIRELWGFWRSTPYGRAFRALIAEAQTDAASVADLRERFIAPRRHRLRVVIDRAIARGEIPPQPADLMMDVMFGFCWYRLLTDQLDDDGAIEAAVDIFLTGITQTRRRDDTGEL